MLNLRTRLAPFKLLLQVILALSIILTIFYALYVVTILDLPGSEVIGLLMFALVFSPASLILLAAPYAMVIGGLSAFALSIVTTSRLWATVLCVASIALVFLGIYFAINDPAVDAGESPVGFMSST